jgi:membrane protease YdiL (CAAX protease family)
METGALDHILAAILVIGVPLYAYWEFRSFLAQVEAGVLTARIRAYRLTIAVEWGLVAAILAVWLLSGRAFSNLGLGSEGGTRLWIGAGLALLGIAFFVVQARSVARSPENLEVARGQFGDLRYLMPHNANEMRCFIAVSITAGICEEIMYRGFFIAYMEPFSGIWPAVFLSSLVFGLGHAYQGTKGILKTSIAGLIMAGLYQLTGTLWAPMVLHASIDAVNGYLGFTVMKSGAAE